MSNHFGPKRDKKPALPIFRRHFKLVDRIGIGIGTPNPVYYRCTETNDEGHVFQRVDQPSMYQDFSHAHIAELENREDWRYDPDWFDAKRAETRLVTGIDRLRELPLDEYLDVLWKYEICTKFIAEKMADRTTKSDDPMKETLARIALEVTQKLLDHAGRTDKEVKIRPTPHPKTVRGWLNRFEASGHDPLSLRDRYQVCGSKTPSLDGDSEARVYKHALTYADAKRPSKRRCWENLRDEIKDLNDQRRANGESELPIPSQKTMDRAIDNLNQFDVDAARHGTDYAKTKYYIASGGLDVVRPGERIEIDEWKISLQTLFSRAGLWWKLNPHHRDAMAGKRWWLSRARDIASQCTLAMRIAPTPTADMASATLRMAVSDKSAFAEFAGCQSPWNQRCGLQFVVTDMGSGYVSDLYRGGVLRLNGTVFTPPASLKEFRSSTERSFGSLRTRALSLYSGQTGANVLDRGDEDPRKFASREVEDLAFDLVRFVVDCEHNLPSAALNGETPARAWRRLTALYGTVPPPDRDTIRNTFGVRLEARVLDKRGVRFQNLHYQSLALQEYLQNKNECLVDIIVDPQDLGWISVKIGERGWLSVRCIRPGFDGFHLEEWTAVQDDMRRRFAAEAAIDEHIVRRAMSDLRAASEAAFRRANLGAISTTAAQIDATKRSLIIAWRQPTDPNFAGLYDAPDMFVGTKPANGTGSEPPVAPPSPRKWSLD